jgi:hypothetical protein
LATALAWSGVCNLRLRRPGWTSWFAVALVAGGLFFVASPLLGRAYWTREAERIAAQESVGTYFSEVRPEFWQPEAAREIVDWKVSAFESHPDFWARSQLESLLATLESLQAANLEFADLAEEVRQALASVPADIDPSSVGTKDVSTSELTPGESTETESSKDGELPVSDPVEVDSKDYDTKDYDTKDSDSKDYDTKD